MAAKLTRLIHKIAIKLHILHIVHIVFYRTKLLNFIKNVILIDRSQITFVNKIHNPEDKCMITNKSSLF